ncbi:MmgE/PrpD family protein [Methanobrevibacter sp. OttesenSCG-928-K11]|nr:MmgE/PrpD family protein [Methanobrevibacter sp. OttesenSCG-928-K11]MDL2270847.1 MmgE/PrpD family protein [Methanobrevibacter sp. OttesenSCG-928-I08]
MILNEIFNFIYNFKYENAKQKTIQIAKIAFIDFFGVTRRGFREDSSQIAFNTISELFSHNQDSNLKSSVIGFNNYKINPLNAGFVNGISAHNLELDDGHKKAQMHLGSIIFPTALAISEAYDLSGKDFLESVIVGYDVGIFLGSIVNPQHRNNGFHTTGTIGTFVSGVVASKLLNFNLDDIKNTFGLCGTQSAGLLESGHSGSMGKSLHVGKAIYNGLLSAFLTKNGFTGSKSIFTGKDGFLNSHVFKPNSLNKQSIFENIGNISLNDIYFKKYPFCRHLHSSIDTILKLRINICEKHDAIDKLFINTYNIAAEHNNYSPNNKEDLKQSLPYAVAMNLVCGEVDIDIIDKLIDDGLFDENSTNNEVNEIKELVSKIVISADENLNAMFPNKRPSNIVIKLDESFRGGIFQNTTMIPKGDIENPLQPDEIIDKFINLNPHYDLSNLSVMNNLENYNVNNLMNILNK